MPVISATTRFVTGSIIWMLSPAMFVWMIRSFKPPLLEPAPRAGLAGGWAGGWAGAAATEAGRSSLTTFFPWTQAAMVCHSGAFGDVNRAPAPCHWSPSTSLLSVLMGRRLGRGLRSLLRVRRGYGREQAKPDKQQQSSHGCHVVLTFTRDFKPHWLQ